MSEITAAWIDEADKILKTYDQKTMDHLVATFRKATDEKDKEIHAPTKHFPEGCWMKGDDEIILEAGIDAVLEEYNKIKIANPMNIKVTPKSKKNRMEVSMFSNFERKKINYCV